MNNLKIGINRIVEYRCVENKERKYKENKNFCQEAKEYLTKREKSKEEEKKEKKEFSFSKRSQARLKVRLSWFVEQSKFKTIYSKKNRVRYAYKLAMLTLTLPAKQKEDDRKNKNKFLNHFLTIMRRRGKIINYIWRAEKQKNGNIHYHIIIDKYIHHSIIREVWNSVLKKAGYLEKWKNPNSIDIHALKNIKNVHAYLLKYMSKEEEDKGGVKGRSWSCSTGIVKNCVDIDLSYDEYENYLIKQELKKLKEEKIIKHDFFTIYIIDIKEIVEKVKEFKTLFRTHINNMRIALNIT